MAAKVLRREKLRRSSGKVTGEEGKGIALKAEWRKAPERRGGGRPKVAWEPGKKARTFLVT